MSLARQPGQAPAVPISTLALLARATRARVASIMLVPATLGSVLAWPLAGTFRPGLWLLTVAGAVVLHLAANVTNDLFDYLRGTDPAARARGDAVATDSGVLTGGLMTVRQVWALNLALYGAAGLIAAYFFTLRGWPVVYLAGSGVLLAVLYVAGPAYGYIGRGLGELGIFTAFGPLPVAGAYLVQTGSIPAAVVLASIPVGLYATLILFNHHFLHWRNDREVGKRNLVAVLGPQRAAPISLALLGLTYASIPAVVAAGALPPAALAAVLTLPGPWRAARALQAAQDPATVGALMAATVRGHRHTGLLLILAVVATGAAARLAA